MSCRLLEVSVLLECIQIYRGISVPKNGLFATFLLKNSVCKTMVIRVDQFYKVIEDFFFIT